MRRRQKQEAAAGKRNKLVVRRRSPYIILEEQQAAGRRRRKKKMATEEYFTQENEESGLIVLSEVESDFDESEGESNLDISIWEAARKGNSDVMSALLSSNPGRYPPRLHLSKQLTQVFSWS